MHWCYHCYGVNPAPSGPCVHCGQEIAQPNDLSYDQQLIWALGHPDGDRAIMAARTLGIHRAREAVPRLHEVALDGADPFLAAEALRSLVAIEGVDPLRLLLTEFAEHGSLLPAGVATEALRNARPPPAEYRHRREGCGSWADGRDQRDGLDG
ncbi:MAG TPA: HEAT repeat domain-containing protein [Solirubrobacterales bacterium]|nr:HEAT repeat domain-containing protein [Solirubrobacterales bacterium]